MMAKKKNQTTTPKMQNLTAKHSRNMAGAGQHIDKQGNKAPRVRQKRQWKKEMNETSLITQINADIRYDNSDEFSQALADVENQFGINLSENFSPQQASDMDKIIKHYGESFFRDNTAEQIANDLEMLEYQPEEIEAMVTHMMPAVERMWMQQGK